MGYLVPGTWYQVSYLIATVYPIAPAISACRKRNKKHQKGAAFVILKIFLSNGQPKNIEIRGYIKNNYD